MTNNNSALRFLTKSEFANSAKKSLSNVFAYPCLLSSPFTPKMESRIVVFNSKSSLDEELLIPIISTAKHKNDTGFYFSFVEVYDYKIWYPGMPDGDKYLETKFIPFQNLGDYLGQMFLTNHIIYSQEGDWGAFVSVDHFTILGSTQEFNSQVITKYPDGDKATDNFIQTWKEWNKSLKYNLEWIPKLLEHVYGKEKAQKIIQKHELE